MTNLRVGQLAHASGLTEKTLRYYDQIGLLKPSGRSAAGYRLYDEGAIERLDFIRAARGLGLSLSDIQDILAVSDGGRTPCPHVLAVVERHLLDLDTQVKRLRALRKSLLTVKARLDETLSRGGAAAGRPCHCITEPV